MTMIWQTPDSTANGVIQPQEYPGPFEADTLENWLQHWVAAVAHLDGELTRPRWQRTPPNIPDFDTPCWLSLGIVQRRPLGIYAWVAHDGRPRPGVDWPGEDQMQRHEELQVDCTFYGPLADLYATNFHSNLMIWQNTHILRSVGMAFADISEHQRNPEYIKEQWLDRTDKTITLRRVVLRSYPVRTLIDFYGYVFTNGHRQYRAPFGWPKYQRYPMEGDAPEDDILRGRRDGAWEPALPRAGGQMEGPLDVPEPQQPQGATPRRYVHRRDAGRY